MKNTVLKMLFVVTCLLSCQEKIKEATNATNETNTTLKIKTMTKEDAIKLVKPFYDFLGGDATVEEVQPSYHDDWKSFYDNSGARTMEETVGFVSGPLAEMIPDLKWKIMEVYVNEESIVVRGEATGTPVGASFMGTPITGGKSFKFMSIDIHELEGEKIKRTYHIEDWLSAIQQVSTN